MSLLAFEDSMALGQALDRPDSAVLDSLCRELLGQDSMDSDILFKDITLPPDVSRLPTPSHGQVPPQRHSVAIPTMSGKAWNASPRLSTVPAVHTNDHVAKT